MADFDDLEGVLKVDLNENALIEFKVDLVFFVEG